MKAVRMHDYGGLEVLAYEDVPRPEPAADEVLIRIHAASVNPVDWKIRSGQIKFPNLQLPHILGCDLAGIVEAIGSDVRQLRLGDEVFGYTSLMREGTYAEFIAAKETEVAIKPRSIDFIHAAAIPVATLTAWQALLDIANLQFGNEVLIHAAAGGVGSMAVQLASLKGGFVVGTASERNLNYLRQIGAARVIDYKAVRFEDEVIDFDIVFDTIGGDVQQRSYQVLKEGGMLVSAVSPPPESDRIRTAMVQVQPNADQLGTIAAMIDDGKLKASIETVLPLREVAQAHELSQSGRTRGKIILQIA